MSTVTLKIPAMLARLANGQKTLSVQGRTVREAIDDLERQFPGFKGYLYTSEGDVHKYINVYLDQDNVRFLEGLDTELKSADVISIIPAIAGG